MVDVIDYVKKISLCYSFTLIYQEKQASFAFHITPTAALKVGQTDTKLCLKEELLIKNGIFILAPETDFCGNFC